MLLALDFHLRGIEPEPVAGFRTWLKLGRCVRKGEHGIRIAARVTPKKAEPGAEQPERDQSERSGTSDPSDSRPSPVFGLSQTDPLPGVEQLPLEPPCEPLTGDSHAHLLEPLGELASRARVRRQPSRRSPARPAAGATRTPSGSSSTQARP